MPVPYVGHRDKGGSVAEDKASAQKAEEAAEGDASTINNLDMCVTIARLLWIRRWVGAICISEGNRGGH